MNVLAPPKARLGVEVVHDLICPWCYLGVRRLFRTLQRRPDLLCDLTWRPFLLNPDMPRAGMARTDYVIRKFGGEDRARRLYASITEIGHAEGVQFRFDRIRRTPSSVDAHRLGINGVPCFVVGGRHAIAGAQEPEVIERLLDVAAVEAIEF